MSRKKAAPAQSTVPVGADEVVATPEAVVAITQEQAEHNPSATPPDDRAAQHEDGDERNYPPEPNPFSARHSNAAGVQLLTRREPYRAELVFQEKPSQAVIDFLKDNGFEWNRQERFWTRPINFNTRNQDRLIATRTYHKAVEMISEEKGLAAEPTEIDF